MEKFSKKDKVFARKTGIISKFVFDKNVADCFDDMVTRSIPFYDEIHRINIDLINRYYKESEIIYDLGCSTGTTIALINKFLNQQNIKSRFIGIDNSEPMIKKAENKIKKLRIKNCKLMCKDLNKIELQKSQIIIMNYTLQFIAKKDRLNLIKNIYSSLNKGGIFIMTEKIKIDNRTINQLLIDLYYDFKRRNGYSELEISRKRDALENVLIPVTPSKQLELIKRGGFKKVDMIFRWYNFACFLGIK